MIQSALAQSLSGFWHRFFSDVEDIDVLFRAVETQATEFYTELASESLGSSLVDAPVSRPEGVRLWRIKETDVRRNTTGWLVTGPVNWHNIRYLQDQIVNPTTILDSERDFQLRAEPGVVYFKQDPRKLMRNAARRTTEMWVGGRIITPDATGVGAGDVITVSGGATYKILYSRTTHINGQEVGEIGLSPDLAVTEARTGITWTSDEQCVFDQPGTLMPAGVVTLTDTAVWVLSSRVDDYLMSRVMGNVTGEKRQSSEVYRDFLRGIARLYLQGPSIRRLEEGISAYAGLPAARQDGEVITELAGQTITTNLGTYVLPVGFSVKPAIASAGAGYVMRAFEPFTDAVRVVDSVSHPTWWHGKDLPQHLLVRKARPGEPSWSSTARYATMPNLYPNRVGQGSFVGDPVTRIGDKWHYSPVFELTHTVLQHNLVGVWLHPSINYIMPMSVVKTADFLKDVRPAHTYAYVWDSTQPPT